MAKTITVDLSWEPLGEIACLLQLAADHLWEAADAAGVDSPLHSLGLGSFLAAAQATQMLPAGGEVPDHSTSDDPASPATRSGCSRPSSGSPGSSTPASRVPATSASRSPTWSERPATVQPDPTLPVGRMFAGTTPKHAPVMAPVAVAEDLRSVGELLIDADHHARNLLLDTEAEAAPGLLRSWSATVSAAAALWETFPAPGAAQPRGPSPLERVAELATSVQADLDNARWPGGGPGDYRMRAIADNLTRHASWSTGTAAT